MRAAWAALAAVVLALCAGIWIGGHPDNLPGPVRDVFVEQGPAEEVARAAEEATEVIQRKYYRPVAEGKLEDSSIRGMVEYLRESHDDRFSHYFDAEQLAQFNESITGRFSGVGMTVGANSQKGLRVGFVFKRSPAEEAGIEAGDVIVEVDGESIKGEPTDLIVADIKGPEGTDVTLGLRKDGRGPTRRIELTRAEISVPITSSAVRRRDGAKLGYVRLATFSEGASVALRRAFERVGEKGAEGVVLDLRANGGGLLPEAILTSSLFLPEGDVVVETSSRSEGDTTYRAIGDALPEQPMVVLVNRDTASAAEILTAALQTNLDVPVVGTRTFGKGVFQQVIDLENGGALDITIGEFLTADGTSLAGKGVQPDVRVPEDPSAARDVALDRAYSVLAGEVGSGTAR